MRWLEAVGKGLPQVKDGAEALDSVRTTLGSIDGEHLRVEFHSSRSDRASLSQALVQAISRKLSALGWREKAHHGVKHLPTSHDLFLAGTALRFGFQHEASVLRNLLMPTIESSLAAQGNKACKLWASSVVITATEDFRKIAGMDSAVGTFEDYEVCLRACESMLAKPVTIVGLAASDDFRVVHERDYKGRKRGYVETDE